MNWFDWLLVGVFGAMPLWLVCGNILGTIGGRFAPPQLPVYDRPALTERVAPEYATAHRVTEPVVAPPVIVNVHVAAPSIPGWMPSRADVIDGQVVRELPQGAA